MGRVWAARPLGSAVQRLVAVKTAISTQNQTPEFERRFMDEARIASLAHHPSVCGVHELGEDRGILYLVMDWCDGATLRELIDWLPEERMDPAVAARIVATVASGLHAVHELEDADGLVLDVVHRDVSPHNVLIARSGHVKVADFGVAKARGQLHAPTEQGELKGKLDYMAPEQVTGRDVDRRADVFALGCILYEATTGSRPFAGEGALSTLYHLLEKTITPPEAIVPGYCPALSQIVLRALAKDRAERYETAEGLRLELEEWLASHVGRVVRERDIADLLGETIGQRVDERIQQIAANIRFFGEPVAAHVPFPELASEPPGSEPPFGSPSSLDGLSLGAHPSLTGSGLGPEFLPAAAVSASWAWPLAGAALACGVALFVGRVASVSLPLADVPWAGSFAAKRYAPAQRLLRVETWPRAATVRLDDGPPLAAGVIRGPFDGRLHKLSVSAAGFITAERWIAFDRAQSLLIRLKPLRSPTEPVPEAVETAGVTSPGGSTRQNARTRTGR